MTTPSQETSPIAPSSVEGLAVRKLLWRLLPFLFLLYVVNYLDRINVGFAKLQMQGELGFSNEVFGTAFGIFFFGYSIFQVPSNLALQRVGARRWMAGIMVLWGIVSCCMMSRPFSQVFSVFLEMVGVVQPQLVRTSAI